MQHLNTTKLFLLLLITCSASLHAQFTCKNFAAQPDTNFWANDSTQTKGIHVYDRYGNKYALARMNHKYYNTNPVNMEMEGSLARPISTVCNAGLFKIHFVEEITTGYGFDNASYRNLVCKVFQDISDMLIDVNPANPARVNIFVASDSTFPVVRPGATFNSGELGYGSSFYTLSTPVNNVFADNVAYQTIKLGKTAYSNLPSLITPTMSDGYYHGYLAINFKGVTYNTDINTASIGTNELDMYTAVLHEALHILGISSGIDNDFSSIFGNSIYTRYDENLFRNSTTNKLLTHNAAQTSITNTSGLASANHGCGSPNNFIFTGGSLAGQAIFNNPTWLPGTNLSHLGCSGTGVCNTTYEQPTSDYVMNPCIGLGSNYIKRHPNPSEYKLLCDLGYNLTGSYGNTSVPSVGIYTIYSSCTPPCIAVGENDILTTDYMTPVSLNSVLSNDIPSNATMVRVSLFNPLAGTVTNSGSNFTFTPARFVTGEVYLVYYIKCGSTGRLSSPIYITVKVNPFPIPPNPVCVDNNSCNLVCHGDYEASIYSSHWSNYLIDSPELIPAGNSPDIFRYDNSNLCRLSTIDGKPEGCNNMGGACYTVLPSRDTPHTKGGKQYIGMGFLNYSPFYFEGVHHKLKRPMLVGKKYTLKFLARKVETNCTNPFLEFYGDSMPPCAPPIYVKRSGVSACGFNARKIATSNPINSTTWTQYTISNIVPTSKITDILITPLRKFGVPEYGYANLDNVEIFEDSITPLLITSTEFNPNPCLSNIHRGKFKICLDTSVKDSNATPIQVKLMLPNGFKMESGSGFDANGEYSIPIGGISSSNCVELTLRYSMNGSVQAGTQYNIGLKTLTSTFCASTESSHNLTVAPINKVTNSPISITKSVSKTHPKVGDIITVTLKVCNSDTIASDSLIVVDTLASNMTLINANGFTLNGNELSRKTTLGNSPNNCKTFTYTVSITAKSTSYLCASVNSLSNNCILNKDCIRLNDLVDVCLHKVKQFVSPLNPYSIITNTGYDIISYTNDTFNIKFKTTGNHLVVVYNGSNYDTFPVNVIVPQPYIAVSQNLICNSDFPPTGDNTSVRLTEGKCQKVCENSCVWYYANSYSVYKDRIFKWKVVGAKNINASTIIQADSILICWGSDAGAISLIEETQDGCSDTAKACIEIMKNLGTADFGVLPNIQDTIYYLCDNQEINFKDTSTIRNSPDLESWCWDFGDGNFYCGDVSLDGLPPSIVEYAYTKYGTFTVKLSYTTKCGCEISKTKTVVIDSGTKLNIYCKNPVCPNDTVEYFADSFCAPPYDWSLTNGIIIGSNNNHRVLVQWGDPTDGIGLLTLTAPVGCNVCNPVQTLKVNILPSNPDVIYPLSACAGEAVTHTSIQMSSTKYGWRDMSSTATTDSLYFQKFIVPSSVVAGSNLASYVHQMFLYDKYNQLKCTGGKLYTTRIKDTFRWTGPDTACINISTSYAMNPAVKNADTIEITGDSLSAPVYFFGTSSFAYDFPKSGTYYIKVKDELLCDKELCVKQVYVMPNLEKPQTISGRASVCIEDLEIYRVSPRQSGIKYNWIVPAGDSLINASGDYAQIKFKTGGIKQIGVTASYIPSPYCSSDTTWFSIASATTTASLLGDTAACANDSSIFTVSDNSGYNYTWRLIPASGLGSIIKLSDTKVKLAWNDVASNTNVTIRSEFTVCGMDTFVEKTLTILSSPTPSITGRDTVCIGSMRAYSSSLVSTSTPAYYNWTGTGIQIAGQNQSTTVTFPKTGTYALNLFSRTGSCKAMKKATKSILVLPLPETKVTTIPSCNRNIGITHDLSGTLAIIGNGRYRIINPLGTGQSSFLFSFTGSTWTGNYNVYDSLTDCSINVPVSYDVCDMSTDTTYDSIGNPCIRIPGDSMAVSLSVQCDRLNYNFISIGNPHIKYHIRVLGIPGLGNHVSSTGSISGLKPGEYEVVLTGITSNLCEDRRVRKVTIQLNADMDASVICQGNTRQIFLRDKSTFIEPYYIKTRNWTIKKGTTTVATGTGASYTSPALTPGTYTAYLAVTNDSNHTCYDTQSVTIDSLRVSFTVDKKEICHEGVVKFTSYSPDSAKIAIYEWNFSDQNSTKLAGKYGIKQYHYTGTNPMPVLVITDVLGCNHSSNKDTIKIQPNLFNSNLAYTPIISLGSNNVCINQTPINATVSTLPMARSPYYYKWSHLNEFTHFYSDIVKSGNYYVKVVDKYGCEGTSAPVSVNVYLKPEIAAVGKERICLGDKIDLNYEAGTANLTFNPMTGVSGNQILYQPSSSGNYPISAIATNAAGCSDTLVKNIIVDPKPNLSLSQINKSCRPYEVTLTANGSNPINPLASAYLWTHGPSQAVINVRQGGDYYMKFTDANGCKTLDSIKVEKAMRFLNFPEGCFEVCQDVTNSKPVVFDLSFDRPIYDAWAWYRNDSLVASGINSRPTNPWTINYATAGSFKYHLSLTHKGCTIVSPPIYIVVVPQPCTFRKMAGNTHGTSPRIYPVIEATETWSLYPSPANNKLYIQSNFSLKNKEIVIYSMTGIVLYRGYADAQPINLTRFMSGVYLAQLWDGGKIIGKQTFIIEKEQ